MFKVLVTLFIEDRAMLEQREKLLQKVLPESIVVVVANEAELQRNLHDVDIIVSTTMFPLGRAHMERALRLRLIQIAGVGTDHVDLEAASQQGIIVANVEGANAVSVAEHVIMSALALLRNLTNTYESMKNGGWPFSAWAGSSCELAGKTVGIIGMGCIGQEVAKRFLPFDVSLLYYARRQLQLTEISLSGRQVDLDALLTRSDIVTLHLPLAPETDNILGREQLYRMKKGSFLINTSRAGLVNEDALLDALGDHLGGAALDVFHQEPLPAESPVRKLTNVLLTPHGAGVTIEAQNRIGKGAMLNVRRFIAGEQLADLKVAGRR
ncbi:MAG: 2-hydroxyacid dehydrogenase [Firmicutes bacterium]|nr:2-hydroxyacid dehydrogenase [Bacillota bacterium]MCL5993669.1 2-hydroxyacid dehydrogenase [Bacillota bacterium]